jgi:hypothetical protein
LIFRTKIEIFSSIKRPFDLRDRSLKELGVWIVFGVHFVFVILLCFLLGNTRYFTPRCVIHCRPLTPSPLCVPPLFSFHCQSVQTHSHHTSEHTLSTTQTHTLVLKKNLRVYIFWFANGKRMKTSKVFAVCRRVCSFFIWTTMRKKHILEPTH